MSRLVLASEGLVFCGMLCGAQQIQEADDWRRGRACQKRLSSSRVSKLPRRDFTNVDVWTLSLCPTDGSVLVKGRRALKAT